MMWLAAAYAAGIVSAKTGFGDSAASLIATTTFVAMALVLRDRSFTGVFVLLAFAGAGAFSFQIESRSVGADRLKRFYEDAWIVAGDPIELEGMVIGGPDPAVGGYFLRLRSTAIIFKNERNKATGDVRLFAPIVSAEAAADHKLLDLRHGTLIRAACAPEREERFLNPGVMSRSATLELQRYDAASTVKSPLMIEVIDRSGERSLIGAVHELRRGLIERMQHNFSPRISGVLIAATLGSRYFLEKQTADVFRDGGTFHILVISGLHITFIGGMVLLAVRSLTRRRIWQFVFPVIFLWAFTVAVGADPPAVRASLMFTLLLFSYLIFRSSTMLNSLGACAILLLAWRPSDLFNPSFQLTFVSLAAIVGMAFPLIEKLRSIGQWTPTVAAPLPPTVSRWLRRFCETLYWNEAAWKLELKRQVWSANLFKDPLFRLTDRFGLRRALSFSFEAVLVSMIVQLWMLPLLVYYFHRVSIASVILNLWVGVLMAASAMAAVFSVAAAEAGQLVSAPFVQLTEMLGSLMIAMPALLTSSDMIVLRPAVYSGPLRSVYFLYFMPLLALAALQYDWDPFRRGKTARSSAFRRLSPAVAAAFAIGLSLLIAFHPFSSRSSDGMLRVEFLDVGQGDAALITFPNGETMLIDGGGRTGFRTFDDEDGEPFEPDIARIGEAVVSEFLWEHGITRVDHIVASHPHTDHTQGLADVARNFRIGAAHLPPVTAALEPGWNELVEVLNRRKIPASILAAGDSVVIGGVNVEVLWPVAGHPAAETSNNGSLVIRLRYRGHSILFMGDIEREAESALLEMAANLRSEVVKAPHHGSRTSSTRGLVEAVNAQHVVISVGRRSMFGHPHPEVVERWRVGGAAVITTGERGMVTVSTDGSDLQVNTFVP
jgi:competence protein ComEC